MITTRRPLMSIQIDAAIYLYILIWLSLNLLKYQERDGRNQWSRNYPSANAQWCSCCSILMCRSMLFQWTIVSLFCSSDHTQMCVSVQHFYICNALRKLSHAFWFSYPFQPGKLLPSILKDIIHSYSSLVDIYIKSPLTIFTLIL